METTKTRQTQHNTIHESICIERLEQAHRKAMDIEDGACMDDEAGVMDCPITRERMYADRLRRAYKYKREAESIGDPTPDTQAQLNATTATRPCCTTNNKVVRGTTNFTWCGYVVPAPVGKSSTFIVSKKCMLSYIYAPGGDR